MHLSGSLYQWQGTKIFVSSSYSVNSGFVVVVEQLIAPLSALYTCKICSKQNGYIIYLEG